MKLNINLGAYGWQHAHWSGHYYPGDLPKDWQLTYYSNAFNAVLVPLTYWQAHSVTDCVEWMDNVHDKFQFFVECGADMFADISIPALSDCLQILQPQLSALVCLDGNTAIPASFESDFVDLINRLEIDLYSAATGSTVAAGLNTKRLWREADKPVSAPVFSDLAFIENDLKDLRAVRTIIEPFLAQLETGRHDQETATIIVSHPGLQPGDLSKFRAVLEIMGY